MTSDSILRDQIVQLLKGGNAHYPIIEILEKFPLEKINEKIDGVEYTPWQLLEHIRIAQLDILDFTKNNNYKELNFPDDLWPEKSKQADIKDWNISYIRFKRDLEEAIKIAEDESIDLFTPLEHAKDYNVLRELLLIADHNAYHLGQFILFNKIYG
jgi:hypothetical protein